MADGIKKESTVESPLVGSPIEFGHETFVNNLSCLYPYVRGCAYLASGRAVLPPPSFRRSPTIAALSGTAGPEHWLN
jgi:hypothetical protein